MGKKKALPPRVKRMKRAGRLASAKSWLPTYTGKSILRGYCKHFAVNWRCAAMELKQLGIKLDPEYLAIREKSEAETVRKRQEKKQEQAVNQHWHPYSDPFEAYLASDFAALHELELRRHYSETGRLD